MTRMDPRPPVLAPVPCPGQEVCSLTAERVLQVAVMAQTFGPVYDTHAAVRRLTEAGIPEPLAEAVVREQTHILEHNLATKADIETLRQETRAEIAAVRADVEKLRLETRADIEKLRQETKASIEVAKTELIKWMVGTNLGVVALVIAALKLL